MSDKKSRATRRAKERLRQRMWARGEDPGAKFGKADPRQGDRREKERRNAIMSPAQVEARMRELGITADRRKGSRRGGERRMR